MKGYEYATVIIPSGKKVVRIIRDAGSGRKYIVYKKEIWIVTQFSYTQYALSHIASIY